MVLLAPAASVPGGRISGSMKKSATSRRPGDLRAAALVALCCLVAPTLGLGPAGRSASPPHAGEDRTLEYRVKAAFLYNFVRFVEWPDGQGGSDGPFVIGILGQDPFGPALDGAVRGKSVAGRPLVVRRLGSASEARGCHLLFMSAKLRRDLPRVLDELDAEGVLTVSELDTFLERGGMINFVIEGDRVAIDINLDAAREAGLDISSQLLRVARNVRFESGRPGQRPANPASP